MLEHRGGPGLRVGKNLPPTEEDEVAEEFDPFAGPQVGACEEPGCTEGGWVACRLPDHHETGEEHHYCREHAFAHGYCKGCGDFWGGVESFEFLNNGYCDNCRSQIDADMRDERDDDDETVTVYVPLGWLRETEGA